MNTTSKSTLSVIIVLLFFFISFIVASQNNYKDFCKNDDCLISIVEENNDFSLCELSENPDNCYSRISRIFNNSQLCINTNNQSSCLYDYALYNLDYDYCFALGNLSDNCVFDIAVRLENSSLCEMTKNINYCYYSYALLIQDANLCNLSENYKNACLEKLLEI